MNPIKFALAALLAALVLGSGQAQAQPNKCQGSLEKISNGLIKNVTSSLKKCADGVQKTLDKGDTVDGKSCDGAINKINSARAKSLSKCLGAKCTDTDLLLLGHLVSGLNAPTGIAFGPDALPASGLSFVCAYLVKRAEHLAWQSTIAAVPTLPDLLKAAADADPTAMDGIGAFAHGVASGPPWPDAQPSCTSNACTLTSSGASVKSDGSSGSALPMSASGIAQFDVCRLAPNSYTIDDDSRVLSGGLVQSIDPPTFLGGDYVCARSLRIEGWCNCGPSTSAPRDIDICQDGCANGVGTDACTQTTVLAAGDPNAPNCGNGDLKVNYSTASTTGDCFAALTADVKLVPMGSEGSDGIPCTFDDPVAPSAATSLELTTGTASGAVRSPASTSAFENPTSYTDTRSGAAIGSCANLDAGNLTGLKFVGQLPVLDAPLPTGDTLISLTLQCS